MGGFFYISLIFIEIVITVTGQCPEPEDRPGMIYTKESETTVKYKCDVGYVRLLGDGTSVCSQHTWSQPSLECTGNLCPSPPIIENSRTIGTDFTFGHTVKYECQEGYGLVSQTGNTEIVCLKDGSWTGLDIACKAIECPRLDALKKGSLKATNSNLFNSRVTFTCNRGFMIKGAKEIVCTADGVWSHPQPTCGDIECLDPDSAEFKEKYQDVTADVELGHGVGHRVTFKCVNGDKKLDSECTNEGEWKPAPPECKKKTNSNSASSLFQNLIGLSSGLIVVLMMRFGV